MKYLLAILLTVTGCHTQTTMCVDMAEAQYREISRRAGKDNAQLWKLSTANPKYKYHLQAKERRNGVWYWVPNRPYTEVLSKDPQHNCKPIKRLK